MWNVRAKVNTKNFVTWKNGRKERREKRGKSWIQDVEEDMRNMSTGS